MLGLPPVNVKHVGAYPASSTVVRSNQHKCAGDGPAKWRARRKQMVPASQFHVPREHEIPTQDIQVRHEAQVVLVVKRWVRIPSLS